MPMESLTNGNTSREIKAQKLSEFVLEQVVVFNSSNKLNNLTILSLNTFIMVRNR